MKYEWDDVFTKELKQVSEKYLKELEKIDDTPIIIRDYKFWQHPIKWFKDIKKFKIMNELQRVSWKDNKKVLYKAMEDMYLYGTAIINPKDFK